MEKFKWLFAVVGGAIASFGRQYSAIILFVMIAIVMDIITGITKAKVSGEGLNSEKATKGFWKKFALFIALFFAFFLDYFIPYMLQYVHVELPNMVFIGMICGCYIVINEGISILENLFIINPSILPKWLTKVLTSAKEQIDTANSED